MCKILLKESEEDINKWKDIPHSQIRRFNIVKMSILPKAAYGFSVRSIRTPMAFFTEIEKTILKYLCNHRRHRIAEQS